MDFDMRKLSPHALDACTGDLLAVVKLQSLQASAVLQVLQRGVRDKKAVVQLQHPESSCPQVLLLRCRIPSSVMSSQWDKLRACSLEVDGELDEGAVGNQDTFFKVHLLQLMAIPS